jgi:threonylcarbamoyladenosine tRNA methylthiotransferase MtaB
MKRAAFYTLGCKLNFSETSTLARNLESHGYSKVSFEEAADVYVINTCSVTENADRECKKIVKDALKANPEAYVVVTGCFAQLKPEAVAGIPGVDLVLGAGEKFHISHYLTRLEKEKSPKIHCCETETLDTFEFARSSGDRTRSFLKVQDGCDYPCTYCTIPMARGKSRSPRLGDVIAEAEKSALLGVKEIVLTGVNIGDYRDPETGQTLIDLIRELDTIEGITRFRISSIEPNLLSDEIIDFVAGSKRFASHFHIPLQSGSDRILGLMKRRYRRALFASRVAAIKKKMPHACIGVDVIVGFQSETEEDFKETLDFLTHLDVSYLHVFTYSERDNTEALEIKPVVPFRERKERNKILRMLSAKKLAAFYENCEGQPAEVLFESPADDGSISGFSANYVRVKIPYTSGLENNLVAGTLQKNGKFSPQIPELSSQHLTPALA